MRGIFLVSILIICTVAVLWRRFGVPDTKNPEQQAVRDSLYAQKRVLQYNTKVYSQAIRLANDGDIVVRMNIDSTNKSINNAVTKIESNQAGIIIREHDTVFVYYATINADNPNGRLFREPFWNFSHPKSNNNLTLLRIAIDSIATQKLLLLIRNMYIKVKRGSKLKDITRNITNYDSSFIAGSFREATNDSTFFQSSNKASITIDEIIRKAKKIKSWDY
jgi:hypothetical protein